MKLVYSHRNFAQVTLVRSLLENEGIPSVLRNKYLSTLMGELPALDTWPEIWVADEDQFLAQSVISQHQSEPEPQLEAWGCPRCGAENEGNMGICWNCDYEIDNPIDEAPGTGTS